MSNIGLQHYLILSAVLFSIGLYGALAKRNAIVILMCLEIMLNAVNIALVAFSRYVTPTLLTGQVFAIFIIVVAAAETAVGLAIIISIYRRHDTIESDKIDMMKW
ncbi:MAG TPA: NADH-quinone oxidoreductase subunit NuoK [Dehalococcoidales bacterium]|nr:NADH-quinone oxidoreductase subunit NuoK [Dehalococcoidales bacterium]